MINAILGYWANPWIAVFLYWLPLSVCAVGYTLRTFENYYKDIEDREKYIAEKAIIDAEHSDDTDDEYRKYYNIYYRPTDTIGTLIGRGIVTIMPIANMWAAIFDISPKLFSRFIERVEELFDQPLVPRPKP